MSVLIKGVSIPKSCNECKFRQIRAVQEQCPQFKGAHNLVYHSADAVRRKDGCPLQEVDDPRKDEDG